ncbi:hypothetical protein [Zavarzinia sp. CC-PAN008]|uniref:hypothetical protein n=1 Tax=Zavarzinia sp. CC-PAN008 TaxID=3243332 RepID=UPI003F743218
MNLLEIAVYAVVVTGSSQPFTCSVEARSHAACTNGLTAILRTARDLDFSNGISVRRGIDGTLLFSSGVRAQFNNLGQVAFSNGLNVRKIDDTRFIFDNGLTCRIEKANLVRCAP